MNERAEAVDPGTLSAALSATSWRPIAPWAASTGLRSHPLRHRALGSWSDPRVAEDFLVNSRLRRGDRETEYSIEGYFTDPSVVMLALAGQERPNGGGRIALHAVVVGCPA